MSASIARTVLAVLIGLAVWATAASSQQTSISDVESSDRSVVLRWTRAPGDTTTPAQRLEVPLFRFLVSKALNFNVRDFRTRQFVTGRGAANLRLNEFGLQVGNQEDFYLRTNPPPPPAPGTFGVTGAFPFGADWVAVAFGADVDSVSAVSPANYGFTPALDIGSVQLQANRQTVLFRTTSPLPASTNFTVTVTGVTGSMGEALPSGGPFAFSTPAEMAMVRNIDSLLDEPAFDDTLQTLPVTAIGQVFIPAGNRINEPLGFIQDGSGNGIALAGAPLIADVDTLGNVVLVSGTGRLLDEVVSIENYTVTKLASTQPHLAPVVVPLKLALSPRWEGGYIQVTGRLAGIDEDTFPDDIAFTSTILDTLFGGYRVWRSKPNDLNDFVLLRSYSLLDSTWTFDLNGPRVFCDPDSIIARGTERDPDAIDIPGPFNGVEYRYALTTFNAVIDATIFPPRSVVFENAMPEDNVYPEIIVPNKQARQATPLLQQVRVVPNPYNPGADFGKGAFPGSPRVQFTNLPNEAKVDIYTVAGDRVRTLNKEFDAGTDTMVWDLKNENGSDISAGVYIYYVTAGVEKMTGRFVVIR